MNPVTVAASQPISRAQSTASGNGNGRETSDFNSLLSTTSDNDEPVAADGKSEKHAIGKYFSKPSETLTEVNLAGLEDTGNSVQALLSSNLEDYQEGEAINVAQQLSATDNVLAETNLMEGDPFRINVEFEADGINSVSQDPFAEEFVQLNEVSVPVAGLPEAKVQNTNVWAQQNANATTVDTDILTQQMKNQGQHVANASLMQADQTPISQYTGDKNNGRLALQAATFGAQVDAASASQSERLMDTSSVKMNSVSTRPLSQVPVFATSPVAGFQAVVVEAVNRVESVGLSAAAQPAMSEHGVPRTGSQITVQLVPRTLGVVEIAIQNDNGRISLAIQTQSVEAERLLNAERNAIYESLRNGGFAVDEIKVASNPSLDSGNQQSNRNSRSDEFGFADNGGSNGASEDTKDNSHPSSRFLDAGAQDGLRINSENKMDRDDEVREGLYL